MDDKEKLDEDKKLVDKKAKEEEINLDMPKDESENEIKSEIIEEDASDGDEEMIEPYIEKNLDNPEKKPKIVKKLFKFSRTTAMLSALLVVVVGASIFVWTNNSDEASDAERPATSEQQNISTLGAVIASVEGNVQHSKDGKAWIDSAGGESLANLDYVRTLSGSRAIILFDDGSVARLDSDSELYLSSLQVDGLEVTLNSGQVYSRVVESDTQSFTVVTANERFKALGTAYKTSTSATKDEIEVYQSKVKVESEDIDVPEGNKYDTETKTQAEIDLAALEADKFAQWNKQKDSESEKFKDKLGVLAKDEEPAPAPTPSSTSSTGIFASGSKASKGITISWSVVGVDTSKGFKVAYSKEDTTPSYGENSAKYVDAGSSSVTLNITDGKTWYARVCAYNGDGGCSNYSNAVTVTAPYVEPEKVTRGTMSADRIGSVLSWSYTGKAPYGFKIVWNTTGTPKYPGSDYKYLSSPSASELDLSGKLTEPGTYYVSVCAYTSGTEADKCLDYSADVSYVVTP